MCWAPVSAKKNAKMALCGIMRPNIPAGEEGVRVASLGKAKRLVWAEAELRDKKEEEYYPPKPADGRVDDLWHQYTTEKKTIKSTYKPSMAQGFVVWALTQAQDFERRLQQEAARWDRHEQAAQADQQEHKA